MNLVCREQIAKIVMDLFNKHPYVASLYIRGSIANSSADEFSDIDIGIDVSGHDNSQFALYVEQTMTLHFDLHFSSWAATLMPFTYVLNFYLKEIPLFWCVDIEVAATPHCANLFSDNLKSWRPCANFLKTLMLQTKYLIRDPMKKKDNIFALLCQVSNFYKDNSLKISQEEDAKKMLNMISQIIVKNSQYDYESFIKDYNNILEVYF